MGVMQTFRMDGRVVVVTGGSKGLGKSMATGFCEAGATVVICSRHAEELTAVAGEVSRETGGRCVPRKMDVTVPADVEAAVEAIVSEFGRIDAWVNNAGMNTRYPIEEFPVDEFDAIVEVNLRGTWLCCRSVAPVMKGQGGGAIINVGSVLSTIGLAERTAYCSSKAAILGLTKTLALELAPFGVRCNALCPGPFLTEINAAIAGDPVKVEAVVGQTALKRWAELPEIQGPALFLASDASSYMTGAALYYDGGWSAG